MAINWRNIDAPSFGAANLLSQSAGNRISEGISQLQSLAAQQGQNIEDEQQKARDLAKTANTEDVLNRIYALGNMEDYNAAVSSGEFDSASLKSNFDGNIDLNQVRTALMSRDNQIMQDENDAFEYQKTLQMRADQPLVDDFMAKARQASSPEAVATLLDEYNNNETLSSTAKHEMAKYGDTLTQQLISRSREEQRFGWDTWNQSRNVKRAWEDDKRAFVEQYAPENRLVLQQEALRAEGIKQGLDKTYPVPEDFSDKIKLGTGLDAVDSWVNKHDSSEIAVVDVRDDIVSEMNATKFKTKDASGRDSEITFQQVPYWAMEQALKEIGLEDPDFFSLDFGKGDISSDQLNRLKKAVETNLATYNIYEANLNAKNAASAKADAAILQAQAKVIELDKLAEKEFETRFKKPRNM